MNVGASGDVIRDIDRAGVKTPVSLLDKGGSGAESLVTDANPLGVQLRDGTTASQVASVSAGGALKVDGSASTQPVSASALPLPTGASSAANQATGNTSLASIDGKLPALATGRVPVDGSGVTQPVSGTFWQTTQPVSGTFWQATQPVSAASLPLPSGAATQTTLASVLSALQGNLAAILGAGTALIGSVASALRTDSIMSGTTSLTPKFTSFSLSATGQVVAAVASKKIRVLRYAVMADSACSFYFRTIATTTQISGTKFASANGGAGSTFCPVGCFETISGEALGLVITGSANVSGEITYVEV